MSKKIIGIDLDEVLRAKWHKFDQMYEYEFGDINNENEVGYVWDLRNEYKWEDTEETTNYLNEELPDDITPLDYVVDPETGEAPVDAMAFRKRSETISADMMFKRFMYQDYCFEIFSNAPPLYRGLDRDLEKFYLKYKDQYDLYIFSKENWFTIPPTLTFLSKVLPRFKNYFFPENNEEIWDKFDVIITTDPELLVKREDTKVVKLIRPYNEDSEKYYSDIKSNSEIDEDDNEVYTTLQVNDLIDNEEFNKLIGYIKPEETKDEKESK